MDDEVDFGGDGLAAELVPAEELADCAATALEADGARILSYGTGAGYTPLRELIAERYEVHPYRVLVTNGWLQGFSLLTQNRLRGQNVMCEYPTYDKALQAIFAGNASLLYLDLGPDGFNADQVEYFVKVNQKPALCYTIPTFHNPTGQSLSLDQRYHLGTWVHNRAGTLMVEDDTYGVLRFEGEPLPTMFELSEHEIVYSTSLSTLIAPGLRVGVFILPDKLAGELANTANSTYISPVLLAQATVFEFLQRGNLEPHVAMLRERLAERRDATLAALEQHFDGATWTRPEGGFFLMLTLPPGTNAKFVVDAAEGVTARAGEDFGGLPNAIRLNFAGPASIDEIEPAIERLRAAWDPTADPYATGQAFTGFND
jgi:DNA-binding transcriptional MocR family regulator